jgi:hypothetical protein
MADDQTTDDTASIARRNFLLGAGTAVAAGLTPTASAEAQQPRPVEGAAPQATNDDALLTLTAAEAAFFSAVADTMIR